MSPPTLIRNKDLYINILRLDHNHKACRPELWKQYQ
ncbi:hypothetical protein J2Z18_002559 [Paenibacillus lactis]|uniref:Uncharacterized protein n=2 Tax=Paenibacillus lactis TaxID=228574 RepID=G4H9I1_9BACL|nr:hypothetical protein PaelaDRAFT_0642 [Paenibacillus lactis 154]MBP1893457.1 hypothetical protein [Paenibacillus lactis]